MVGGQGRIKWPLLYQSALWLVEVGGFTPFHPLTPDRNRHVYTVERGNIVARQVMGTEKFLDLARQQNHGIDLTAEQAADTHGEQAEEEHPMEVDEAVEVRAVPTVRHFVNDLITDSRGKQREMLARHEYGQASDILRVILAALDVIHVHGTI